MRPGIISGSQPQQKTPGSQVKEKNAIHCREFNLRVIPRKRPADSTREKLAFQLRKNGGSERGSNPPVTGLAGWPRVPCFSFALTELWVI